MRFWAAPLIISLALAMFVACGDETTSVTETPAMSVVESGKKMVVCSDDNAGDIVYVKDSSAVFYCADGEWQTLNGKDGADGKDGKDGADGKDGKNGADGKEGAKGQDGSSVKDTVVIRDTIFVNERDTVILLSYDTLVVINRDTVYIQEPASSNSDISSSSQINEVPEGYMRDSRDGRLYKTVQIGNQIWMAENMKLDVNDAYCYNDNKENCEKYGMLYTSTTAKRVCPEGWELPIKEDWDTLLYNIAGQIFLIIDVSYLPYYALNDQDIISELRDTIGLDFSGRMADESRYSGLGDDAFLIGKNNDAYITEKSIWVSPLSRDLSTIAASVRCLRKQSLEEVYGRCGELNEGDVSRDGKYGCKNQKWSMLSIVEQENGLCSSKNEGEEKNGYACSSGIWFGTLVDSRDNSEYKTVSIGSQIWMAENLNFDTAGSYCYNGSADYCAKYGRLYDLYSRIDVCPSGWHLPDNIEWQNLITYIGGALIGGKELKSSTDWSGTDANGVDTYGFSVLPAGTITNVTSHLAGLNLVYEVTGSFNGSLALLLSSGSAVAYFDVGNGILLTSDMRYWSGGTFGSIRCIKDEKTADPED